MEKTGVYGFVVDSAYQQPDTTFQAMPSGLTDAQHVVWIRRHGWQYSYEAFQPPLYYALALPAWELGDAIGGPFGALYAVRIFGALLAALLAPLAMLIALRVWPAQPQVGWAAAVLTAAMPGVDANLTTVTNDVLVSVLGACTVLTAISGRVTMRRALAVGALLGAAVVTKTTAAALVPAVVVALAWRGRWRDAVASVALAALIALPWVISNLAIYGEVITTKEQTAMSAFPQRTAALDFWSVSTLHSFVTFWSGDPFLSLAAAVPLTLVAALLCALAIAGLLRAPQSRELVVLVLAAAGAGLASVTSPVLAAFNAPGRLAYVGVTAVTALVAGGLWLELRSWRLRRAAIGIFAALALVGLALLTYVNAPPAVVPDLGQPQIAHSSALLAAQERDGVHFELQACAIDSQGDLWLDLLIENGGSGAVEWSQTAEIWSGGQVVAASYYPRSAQLPLSVAEGIQVVGWLYMGPESKLPRGHPVAVRLRDVATDDYHAVGDVVITTSLC